MPRRFTRRKLLAGIVLVPVAATVVGLAPLSPERFICAGSIRGKTLAQLKWYIPGTWCYGARRYLKARGLWHA